MIKGALFLLGTVANIAAGAGTYETELLRGVDIYAAQMEKAKRECMQMEPAFDLPGHSEGPQNPFLRPNNNPFEKLTRGGDFSDLQSLWRNKREASEGLVDVDEDDFYEFLQQVNDHRHYKQNAMGNLTCVLQKCGQLTEDMEINMDFYAAALRAEEPENGFTWDAEGSAAKDPEWREKIATAYEDCHELAESWPATSLNRRPMTRMFGRQMIFFKCADRTERRTCRPSMGPRATRRLPSRSLPSACRKTSTTLPPSPSPSSTTLSLRRRSSSRGSSGTSTGTAPCKQREKGRKGARSELNVREMDSRNIHLCASSSHPSLRPLWNDFNCKYIHTSASLHYFSNTA